MRENIIPIAFCFAMISAMAGMAGIFSKFLQLPENDASTRLVTLDGLRGLLAVFVFFHHSYIWFFYLKTGLWKTPESHLFAHLGQSSVEFFFMITAFLFFGKLFAARQIDWPSLYRGRILRLGPAYWLAVALVIAVVISVSGFSVSGVFVNFWREILRWCLFTLPGSPDFGGVANTSLIVASVTWSLRYEWLFYMSLPFFFLLLGGRVPKFWALLGALGFAGLLWVAVRDNFWHLLYFAAGAWVAYVKRRFPSFGAEFRRSSSASVGSLILLLLAVLFFRGSHNIISFFILFFLFWCVSGGNSFWGVLRLRGIRVLGEMSYSLYLLHGFVLYIVFSLIIGIDLSSKFSLMEHWLVISACAPLLLLLCIFSCKWFELPFIGQKLVRSGGES